MVECFFQQFGTNMQKICYIRQMRRHAKQFLMFLIATFFLAFEALLFTTVSICVFLSFYYFGVGWGIVALFSVPMFFLPIFDWLASVESFTENKYRK